MNNAVEVELDNLHKLLKNHLSEEAFQEISEILKPFYAKAQAGKYDLAKVNQIAPVEILQVLEALGEHAYSILYLSMGKPFKEPVWMNEKLGSTSVERAVVQSHIIAPLNTKLIELFGYPSGIFATDFESCLGEKLRQALQHSFNFTEEEMVRHRGLFEAIEGGVLLPLSIYVNLALEYRNRQMESLEPLIRVLPNFIPISELKLKQGTWIVLAA